MSDLGDHMPRPRGRPPKTLEEKIRTGNPGRRPLPDRATLTVLPGASEPPEPSRPLGPTGRAVWNDIWNAGSTWLAEYVDVHKVLILCETYDERQAQRLLVLRDNDRLQRVGLRAIDAQINLMLSDLGFDPVSRSRLGVAEVKRAASAVDDFFGPSSTAR